VLIRNNPFYWLLPGWW